MRPVVTILLAILALAACKDRPPKPATIWTGIPINTPDSACSWAPHETPGYGFRSSTTGTCIVGGRAYLCVLEFNDRPEADRASCALATPPVPAEVPK